MAERSSSLRLAHALALGVPALLMGGALIAEHGFNLFPCEMCWWQRWPHIAALVLALVGIVAPPRKLWVALAAGGILFSGLIGGFHAGVEYGWWEGITGCGTALDLGDGDPLEALSQTSIVRCDTAPWTLLGISLAGFNFLISTAAGLAIFGLLVRSDRGTVQS